jgi:magnesium-transporting ATPase (P-type)
VINFNSYARIIRNGRENDVKWSEVLVGDVCIVKKDDTFPADLLLMGSSFGNGTAFI